MRARYIIIKNIKHHKEKNNISQKELSLRIGKDKDFIKRLENQEFKRLPPIWLLISIARELKVPIQELIYNG